MGKTVQFITCPNGHHRKFYVTMTSVGAKITENADGEQEWHHLDAPDGSLNLYHCADCGAVTIVEHDTLGNIVEEKVDDLN